VNAFDAGVGAVLSQPNEEGNGHPLTDFSRKLLPREQKFSVTEKEYLAIKLRVAISVYLLGRKSRQTAKHSSCYPIYTAK